MTSTSGATGGHNLRLFPSRCTDAFNATDWAATGLGPVEHWPSALRTATQMCLNSQFPMTIGWGSDLNIIYNDGYLPVAGSKHPEIFGQPASIAYAEIWESYVKHQVESARNGDVIWEENLLLPLLQEGALREFYFSFCYSPIADDVGNLSGMMSIATDTTSSVVGERRSTQQTHFSTAMANLRLRNDIADVFKVTSRDSNLDCQTWALVEVGEGEVLEKFIASNQPDFQATLQPYLGQPILSLEGQVGLSGARRDALEYAQPLVLLVCPDPLVRRDQKFREHLQRLQRIIDATCFRLSREQAVVNDRDKLYRLLFEHSTDAILLTVPGGDVFAANPAACALLGRSEQEIQNLPRGGFVDFSNPAVQSALAQRQETGYFSGNVEFVHKNGTPILCEVTSVIFPYENGEDRTMIIFRDAGARQRAEEERENSARLEAIGQLTGGVAHDFNNLLQVIISGTDELIKQVADNKLAHNYASMVFSAALKASDLTSQLLAFSRRQHLTATPTSITSLFSDMDQILERALGEKIQVVLNLREDATVQLDASLAQSAILNLAINAKDAMPGGGQLKIDSQLVNLNASQATTLSCEPGDYVQIVVADTGSGIPEADLSRVIEPFFSTKDQKSGTGLGLSMVFGFVKQSGGALQIASQLGLGTTVTLYFPVTSEAIPEVVSDPLEAISGQGELIVIVEDNPMVAKMLAEILGTNLYQVERFSNGEAALEYLAQDARADFVISDIILGTGIDGWEFANKARQLRPDLKMALMSGFPSEQQATLGPQIPLLSKPFRAMDVLTLVSEQLQN